MLEFFLFTLCVLCGHFEYNKPIFFDNFFLGPPLGFGILNEFVVGLDDHEIKKSCFPPVYSCHRVVISDKLNVSLPPTSEYQIKWDNCEWNGKENALLKHLRI